MYTQYITGRILVEINHTYSAVCNYSTGYWAGSGTEALEQVWELDYHQYWNRNGNEATLQTLVSLQAMKTWSWNYIWGPGDETIELTGGPQMKSILVCSSIS